jgi:hypothetical protein
MTHTRGPHSGQLLSGMDLSNRLGYNLLSALPLPALYVLMAAAALLARLVALPLLRVALHLAGIGPTANSHSLRPGSTAAQQTGYSTGAAAGSKTSGTSQGQASSGSTSASGGTTSGTGGTAGEPRSSGASATLTSWVTPWMGFAKADGWVPDLMSAPHVIPYQTLMMYLGPLAKRGRASGQCAWLMCSGRQCSAVSTAGVLLAADQLTQLTQAVIVLAAAAAAAAPTHEPKLIR